ARLPLEQLDQALFVWLRPAGNAHRRQGVLFDSPSAVILRSARPLGWKAIGTDLIGESTQANHAGQVYFRWRRADGGDECYFSPDERTMILAREADLQFVISAGKAGVSRHAWDDAWMQMEKEPIAIALGSGWLAQRLDPGPPRGSLEAFAPLWTKAHGYA